MDEQINEGTGAIVRKTSPTAKKTIKPKAAAAPAPADSAPPTPTPKTPKVKAKAAAKETETPEIATPKGVKAKVAAATPKNPKNTITTSANGTKATLRLTTVADSKGGITAQENYSFVIDLAKVPKMLECNNPFRVFCNIPPGLLTEAQQDEFVTQVKKAGIDVLKYVKNMEQLHGRINARYKQNLMIYGWVPDENSVVPIFGEEHFTYVFVCPAPFKVYYTRLVASGIDEKEAHEQALTIKSIYYKHLEKNEHVIVTARVTE